MVSSAQILSRFQNHLYMSPNIFSVALAPWRVANWRRTTVHAADASQPVQFRIGARARAPSRAPIRDRQIHICNVGVATRPPTTSHPASAGRRGCE